MIENWTVETERLTKRFGAHVAVDAVSIHVRRGEVFGVFGPTGAGKSTTLRMLCGILVPSGGRATINGLDAAREGGVIRACTGYVTQRFGLYEDLTIEENLSFYAGVYGIARHERRRRIEQALGAHDLIAHRGHLPRELPIEWKQRVALAAATIHRPALIVLDEPTTGIDPVSRRAFWTELHRLAGNGTSVVVSSVNLDEAARCHRIAMMFDGRLLDEGRCDDIVARQNLHAAEIDVDHVDRVERALEACPEVESVEGFGNTLRVVSRDTNAISLTGSITTFRCARPACVTVEDVFVSMMRAGHRRGRGGS
jgi:ABC-2 type transport system ATP-binding protein